MHGPYKSLLFLSCAVKVNDLVTVKVRTSAYCNIFFSLHWVWTDAEPWGKIRIILMMDPLSYNQTPHWNNHLLF